MGALKLVDIENVYDVVDGLTSEQLDTLPCGVIQLDSNGYILKYNSYESNLAQRRKEDVMGRNFFKEVAPCTDIQAFYGRFREGVAQRQLDVQFRYQFPFIDPRNVIITLFYSQITSTVWVFVQTTA
jgi:photoactive yellow protein